MTWNTKSRPKNGQNVVFGCFWSVDHPDARMAWRIRATNGVRFAVQQWTFPRPAGLPKDDFFTPSEALRAAAIMQLHL
jgi:hypothetical protein